MQHTFLYISLGCFARLQGETSRNFLVTPLQNFHVVLPTKKCLLLFLSLAQDLCRPFSRRASLACRFPLFLCLSLALCSKFVDMTINLSLILWTTRIQKRFPLSVFVFTDSLVVSALQDAVAMRFPSKINLSCIWVATPVD